MRIPFVFVFIFVLVTFAQAQKKPDHAIFSTKKGAIDGFDPVAYFKFGKATPGKAEYTYRWQDADWHFDNPAHLADFQQNPEQYAPQYGGYCAYGWSKGYAVKIDPQAWSIVDGKLYLNYDTGVKKTWDKNQAGYIQKADVNWAKAHKKP